MSAFVLCICTSGFFFCFKQKTAYEMRISDWSSDVCSSDLLRRLPLRGVGRDQWAVGHASLAINAAHEHAVPYRDAVQEGIATPVEEIGRASCRERVCQYV